MRAKCNLSIVSSAYLFAIFFTGCGAGSPSLLPPPTISVSVSAAASMVTAGATDKITAVVSNDSANMGVSWSVTCPNAPCGSVSPTTTASGVATTYTAPAVPPASDLTVTITATSVADKSKSATATPTVSAITVTLTEFEATITVNTGQTYTATVNNDPKNQGATWTLTQNGVSCSPGCGNINPASTPSGQITTYTAPSTIPANAAVILTATSISDTTKSVQGMVTIVPPPPISIIISPSAALINVTGTVHFGAGVRFDPNNAGVTWSISGCTGGATVCGSINITNSGADYVAPATVPPGGMVTVTATSVTDPTKSASATVTINRINFTSRSFPAGNTPNGVVVADFNGDGKLDVAVADYGNPSTGDNGGVIVLLGNGDGTFQPAISVNAGKNPISIAVGDFNNDGKEDLVIADFGDRSTGGSGSVEVLLGNGDGTFQAPIKLSAGTEPFPLAVGDFNGDGKLDFAVTDFNSGAYIFLGNGDGTFRPPNLISTGNNPSAIASHDLNGDGKLDLAVAGTPFSGFNSTVNILLGNGDGTFQSPVPYGIVEALPTSIASGDLNGDKKPDLVITQVACSFGLCGGPTITLLGNGDGTFHQPFQVAWGTREITPLSVHIADFTGSGKADLVEANGGFLVVLPGNGDGTFAGPLFFGAGQNPYALATGDFNGDGKPDIVVASHGSNNITILLNATVP